MRFQRYLLAAALCAFAALPLAACNSLDLGSFDLSGFNGNTGEVVSTSSPPPPPDVPEISPVLEDPATELWRPGYWEPNGGGGFNWVPGKIIVRPAPTALWISARWTRHTYGWTFEQGHWQ